MEARPRGGDPVERHASRRTSRSRRPSRQAQDPRGSPIMARSPWLASRLSTSRPTVHERLHYNTSHNNQRIAQETAFVKEDGEFLKDQGTQSHPVRPGLPEESHEKIRSAVFQGLLRLSSA